MSSIRYWQCKDCGMSMTAKVPCLNCGEMPVPVLKQLPPEEPPTPTKVKPGENT